MCRRFERVGLPVGNTSLPVLNREWRLPTGNRHFAFDKGRYIAAVA